MPAQNFPLQLAASPRLGATGLANNSSGAVCTVAALPAGSAVLFDCMTPHASLPNASSRPRRSLFLSYNPASDGDGYRVVSEARPLYEVGSHNLGHLPLHKIESWQAWRRAGEPDETRGGGAALIWGEGKDRHQAKTRSRL